MNLQSKLYVYATSSPILLMVRLRPGARALREIRKYQGSTDLLLPAAPFIRVVSMNFFDFFILALKFCFYLNFDLFCLVLLHGCALLNF